MTFAELQTYVRDRLSIATSDTAKTTQIKAALNRARDRLVADERLSISTANLTFTADTETVTLPSGVMEILSVATDSYVLAPLTRQELANYRLGDATHIGPLGYVVDGSGTTMRIWPAPTETDVVTASLVYVPEPTELSADADTPSELPRAYHDLIAELAIIRLAESEEMPDIAAGARRMVYGSGDDPGLLAGLRNHMSRRTGTGEQRLWPRGYA
jgi:hypothetical protein